MTERKRIVRAHHGIISAMPLHLLLVIVLLFLSPSTYFALEATFTPNPNDAVENGGTGSGPLPASMAQRRQLLALEAAIINSEDPSSTLEHVAKQNGMSSQDLVGVLDRNRQDLRESGQLDGMLAEANAAALGGGGGGNGASASLPRKIVGLLLSIIVSLLRTASVGISRHPVQSTAFASLLVIACLAAHDAPRNGIVISSGSFPPFSRGCTTLFEPPMDYLERYCVDSRERGSSGWTSSLPEPTSKKSEKKKRSSSSSSRTAVGGVGMTRFLEIDGGSSSFVDGDEGSTDVETSRSGMVDGFELITTARAFVVKPDDGRGEGEDIVDEYDENRFILECMRQSSMSIVEERKFSEFIPGNSPPLKFRSFLVASEDDDDSNEVDEGAVMSMKFLGNFGRYGVQPFRISYETDVVDDVDDDDTETDLETRIRSVAYHTLAGGHFDGELRFSIEERRGLGGAVVSVTLAIPKGGRSPPVRLAEAMVSSFANSIAQSSRIRTRQNIARRKQSRGYRERASGRASLKRHLRYEQEKLQEEMAAERKRKWKRNNPDAGHYRPSGHRLKSPNNC
jgi:hypothetical protein